jgi:hypothetical protein
MKWAALIAQATCVFAVLHTATRSHKDAARVLRVRVVELFVKKSHPHLLIHHNVVVKCTVLALAFEISATMAENEFKIFNDVLSTAPQKLPQC